MRVLHVIQAMSRKFGGPPAVLYDLAKSQTENGLDVEIATTNVATPTGGILDVPTDRPVEWSGTKIHYFPVQSSLLLFSVQLRSYLRNSCAEFDIVHIHGLYRFPLTYAAYMAHKYNIPYIMRPHGSLDPFLYHQSSRSLFLKRLYERWFELPNLHAASAIHYTAEEERQRASFLGLRAPSFIVPNGIDWQKFEYLPSRGKFRAARKLGDDTPLVLFLGRINFKKGLDLLIPAFAEVQKQFPRAILAIVGPENDDYGQKVRGWVAEHNLNKSVLFIGHLEGEEVLQAYVDADLFVLPSHTENFGMTVVEAMACGIPTVISDQVNIHREVSQGGTCLVTRCDIDEIAEAICTLLASPEWCLDMGMAGRKLAQEKYSWPKIVDVLTAEYEKAIIRTRHNRQPASSK